MATNQELALLTEQAMILAGFVALAEAIVEGRDTPGIQKS